MVGYQTISRDIRFADIKNISLDFKLKESITTLSEVEFVDKEDKQWARNLKKFKREFLGNKSGLIKYDFINPYELDFSKDKNSNVFRAMANAPLEIINQDLGYKVYFFLEKYEQKSESLMFYGQTQFEELDITDPVSIRQWDENRFETYNGSMHHFFKAVIENNLKAEGFMAYKVSGIHPYQRTNTFYDKVGNEFIELDPGKRDNNLVIKQVNGYAQEASLYGYMPESSESYGLLYWNPNLITSEKGEVQLTLPGLKLPDQYIIFIEGISSDGIPFNERLNIN